MWDSIAQDGKFSSGILSPACDWAHRMEYVFVGVALRAVLDASREADLAVEFSYH
jgi:hypothetical protein